MIPILDTHAHMLYLDKFSYPWCEQVSELNKEFVLDDYMKLTDSKGVGGSIFMEADVAEADMTGEAKFFSQLVKEKNNPLVGVVAACRPE
ncbi:MAG: amidohydrolase, partial [Akkermansiaceae bacterium]